MPAKVTSNTDTIYLPPSFRAELRGPGQCAAYEELKEYYRACATGELPPQLHGLLKKLAEELLKKQDLCRNAASRRPGLSIIRPARDYLLTAAVVLVSATTVALSVPATPVATLGACARGLRGPAAVALGFSKVFPRRRTPAWRCHAPSSSDCRQVPGGVPAPLRGSALSAASAPGRAWGREVPLARQSPEQFFRNWPVVSSSQASSSRSF